MVAVHYLSQVAPEVLYQQVQGLMLCLVYLEVMSILSFPMEVEEVDLAQVEEAHLVLEAAVRYL